MCKMVSSGAITYVQVSVFVNVLVAPSLCNSTPSIVYAVQRDGSFKAVDYLWVNNKASKTLELLCRHNITWWQLTGMFNYPLTLKWRQSVQKPRTFFVSENVNQDVSARQRKTKKRREGLDLDLQDTYPRCNSFNYLACHNTFQ